MDTKAKKAEKELTEEELYSRIGKRMRELREERGKSLLYVGGELGYSESCLSRKENGKRSFSAYEVMQIANYYGVCVSYFYQESEF